MSTISVSYESKILTSLGILLILLLFLASIITNYGGWSWLSSVTSGDSITSPLQKLVNAYPDHLVAVDNNAIIWKDGTRMVFDDRLPKDSMDLLLNADLEEQMLIPYIKGEGVGTPPQGYNPGRLRHEPFFKKMYGGDRRTVESNLIKVKWLPKTLRRRHVTVTTVNDLHKKVEAISNELDTLPQYHPYLKRPGGGYVWRAIKNTDRMSMHSFGIAIDINVKYSDYWEWTPSSQPYQYKNRIPIGLVEIFEKHGFIWGGKWWYYDTMHFEYRPELM